jgi:hypothetical protein
VTTKDKAYIAYCGQQLSAARRGIEWEFTFQTWLEWWGDDLERRGVGPDKLCMMRAHDQGPYSPENCSKGFAKDNAKTAGTIRRHKNLAKYRKGQLLRPRSDEDWNIVRKTLFP